MTPRDLIRAASLAGIDLNVRGGQLYAVLPDDPPADLVATIRAHKPVIITALLMLATSATLRDSPCTRSDVCTLGPADREEAEALAAELARTGGLGQFVNDLLYRWNDLPPADRAAACHCWQLAAGQRDSFQEARGATFEFVTPCTNVACSVLGLCPAYLERGTCAFVAHVEAEEAA